MWRFVHWILIHYDRQFDISQNKQDIVGVIDTKIESSGNQNEFENRKKGTGINELEDTNIEQVYEAEDNIFNNTMQITKKKYLQ